jgi:hypothetical protein
MKFAFIQAANASFLVALVCRVLQLLRQDFYAAGAGQRRRGDGGVGFGVDFGAIHEPRPRFYGSPASYRALRTGPRWS